MTALENAEVVNVDYITDESSRSSESQGTLNPQELDIEIHMKKDKGNKRFHDEATRMEIEITASNKSVKRSTNSQKNMILDLDESINQ